MGVVVCEVREKNESRLGKGWKPLVVTGDFEIELRRESWELSQHWSLARF